MWWGGEGGKGNVFYFDVRVPSLGGSQLLQKELTLYVVVVEWGGVGVQL